MGQSLTVRDLDPLVSWHADWRGVRAVVLGLGVTGFSAADTLVELGGDVLVVAGSPESSAARERADLLSVIGARLAVQESVDQIPDQLEEHDPELVIVSPGYRADHPLLLWAAARGIAVWGDIELAWRLRDRSGTPADWICVTGTNGKTTTVQLATHLLLTAGRRAAAVGNIGTPVLDAVRDPVGFDTLVVELSSFQLHWIPRRGPGALAPAVSVCLNLADDHLDWHGSRELYAAAKGTVYANTRIACVYNRADDATRAMVEAAEVQEGCRAIGFGLDAPGPSDFGIVGDIVLDRAFLPDRHRSAIELTTHGELQAAGLSSPHLAANVLAAAALVRAVDVPADVVRAGLSSFRVDHHRTEPVAFEGGILWIDDSKATNPHAADAALTSFDSVVWIVGGLLKGVDISDLVARHAPHLAGVVVIGRDRDPVLSAFRRHAPEVPLFEVTAAHTGEVMPEAVRYAASVARSGDCVLLAPAAASMDQFADYADRGTRFAAAVKDHLGGADDDDQTAGAPPGPGGADLGGTHPS